MERQKARTGSAQIKRQGQTASGKYGNNPNATVKGGRSVTDLKMK